MTSSYAISKNVLGALRGIAPKPAREYCDLCHVLLAGDHPHLLQASNREVLCACDACAILFSHRGEDKRFWRIPRNAYRLTDFVISDAEWSVLRLPIDLAFFLKRGARTPACRVPTHGDADSSNVNATPVSATSSTMTAFYPSPAGCTESLLDLDAWDDMARNNPELNGLLPDVEALLVNRTRGRRDYFIAPIDQCYKLTGLIRRHWRGFSGGDEVWSEIERFFDDLRQHATDREEAAHA